MENKANNLQLLLFLEVSLESVAFYFHQGRGYLPPQPSASWSTCHPHSMLMLHCHQGLRAPPVRLLHCVKSGWRKKRDEQTLYISVLPTVMLEPRSGVLLVSGVEGGISLPVSFVLLVAKNNLSSTFLKKYNPCKDHWIECPDVHGAWGERCSQNTHQVGISKSPCILFLLTGALGVSIPLLPAMPFAEALSSLAAFLNCLTSPSVRSPVCSAWFCLSHWALNTEIYPKFWKEEFRIIFCMKSSCFWNCSSWESPLRQKVLWTHQDCCFLLRNLQELHYVYFLPTWEEK